MVEVILDASARIFVKEGYAATTTNRIAAAAGVSVGSLYQYFGSKDAIAVELLRRYRERLLELVAERLGTMASEQATLEQALRSLLEALLRAEGINPALHRVLIEQVLRTNARKEMIGFEERLEQTVTQVMLHVSPNSAPARAELAAFIVVRVVLAMVHAAVVDRPALNGPPLVDELTRLIGGYLTGLAELPGTART